jgi:RNA polymerase sigma-70 factor (sigma-E family)
MEPIRDLWCLDGMSGVASAAGVTSAGRSASLAATSTADAASLDELYRRCRPSLLRLAHLLTGSPTAAEDVVHDAFIGFVRAKSVNDPAAYLRRSVVNLSTNVHRRTRRERVHLASVTEQVVEPAEVDETWQLVRALPPRQRAVLVLRFYLDLSEAETAQVLGCRPGTVKSTSSRALAKLKENMS